MAFGQLILVRHAHAAGSDADDPPLSRRGRSQSGLLSTRMGSLNPGLVLHSPSRRAAETAGVIGAEYDDVPVRASDLLADRTPVPSPERRSGYPQYILDRLALTPTDEQDVDGQQISRAGSGLAAMALEAGDRTPVVGITHTFVIGWLVRATLNAPTAEWTRLGSSNTGITIFDCTPDGMELVAFNDTGHLSCDW